MVVKLSEIVKRYDKLLALDHFSMEVHEGEVYGLLGPNGSGKTTAINCMLSLLRYDSGVVQLFGQKMSPDNFDLKRKIGLVMQNMGVYDELTVQENIDYFCGLYIQDKQLRKECVDQAIDFVQLNDFRKFHPHKLSGGLQRRLNLACGIAHRPDLIILDEPTVAVDPQSRNSILSGIKELAKEGKTILYTTHYMEEVEFLCDRLTILDHGKEIITGSPASIKSMSQTGEVIDLDVSDLPQASQDKFKALDNLQIFDYDLGHIHLQFGKGDSNLLKVMEIIEEDKLSVLNLNIKTPSLNDVFLEITGKELRDHD